METIAGQLIVKEAGGLLMDFTGGNNYNESGNLICGFPKLSQAIVKEIRPHLTDTLLR